MATTHETWLERMKDYTPTPWTTSIVDETGHLAVYVDHHDDRGPVLAMTVPSGRYAAYPEARARGYADALAKAQAHADALAERFSREPRTCAHRSVVTPSETSPVLSRCSREAADVRGYCTGHAWVH